MTYGPKPRPFDECYTAEPNTGCWLWLGRRGARGYGQVGFRGFKTRQAHRVSWLIHNGPIPDGLFVCHKCDTPPCVNPDHLFLGTCQDNLTDMARKNRAYRGGPPPKRVVEFRGEEMSLHKAAGRVGLGVSTVWARLKRGWTVEDALSLPLKWGDNR